MSGEPKQTVPIFDHEIIAKYKALNWSDEKIAQKMGISVDEVRAKFKSFTDQLEAARASGYLDLHQQYLTLCEQYRLLGESLKMVALAIGNVMPPQEVRALITANAEETYQCLLKGAIILRPYVPIDPQAAFEATLKQS